jgi:hypothetical protein
MRSQNVSALNTEHRMDKDKDKDEDEDEDEDEDAGDDGDGVVVDGWFWTPFSEI